MIASHSVGIPATESVHIRVVAEVLQRYANETQRDDYCSEEYTGHRWWLSTTTVPFT